VDGRAEVGRLVLLLRPSHEGLPVRLVLRKRARIEDAHSPPVDAHGVGRLQAPLRQLPVDLLDVLDDDDRRALHPRAAQLGAQLGRQVRARHVGFAEEHERPRPRIGLENFPDLAGRVTVAPPDDAQPSSRRRIGRDDGDAEALRRLEQPSVAVQGYPQSRS
jgi:hypothetical protein